MRARTYARTAAVSLAPGVMANRARRYERELRSRAGVTALAGRLVEGDHATVQAGPFTGLRYPVARLADVDAAAAKLLGTYELEIAWVFSRAIQTGVRVFIDVGCADGYYAVGFARASPAAVTYAFDLASSARELCGHVAEANGVGDRVHIAKRFAVSSLADIRCERALVLCDVEGAEAELLTPDAAAALAAAVVVVEVHEDERPGTAVRLQRAFAATHRAAIVPQRDRAEIPAATADWPPRERALALAEFRGRCLHWIVFEPGAR